MLGEAEAPGVLEEGCGACICEFPPNVWPEDVRRGCWRFEGAECEACVCTVPPNSPPEDVGDGCWIFGGSGGWVKGAGGWVGVEPPCTGTSSGGRINVLKALAGGGEGSGGVGGLGASISNRDGSDVSLVEGLASPGRLEERALGCSGWG